MWERSSPSCQPPPSHCYYCTIPYLHITIIAQSPTFTLLLLHNPLPSHCYYCTIPHLHIAIIAQSPTFTLLLLHNPPPSHCYYCTIPYLHIAIIAQSPTFTLLLLHNLKGCVYNSSNAKVEAGTCDRIVSVFVLCCLRVLVLSVCVCLYAGYAVSFWLSLRLQMIGVFIITAAAFIAVLEHHFSFIDPGTPQPPPSTYLCPSSPLPSTRLRSTSISSPPLPMSTSTPPPHTHSVFLTHSPLSPPNTLLSPFLYTHTTFISSPPFPMSTSTPHSRSVFLPHSCSPHLPSTHLCTCISSPPFPMSTSTSRSHSEFLPYSPSPPTHTHTHTHTHSMTGLVGLAISYSLSINSLISQVVVTFSETEKEMVSVERAVEYIERIPAENSHGEVQVRSSPEGSTERLKQ